MKKDCCWLPEWIVCVCVCALVSRAWSSWSASAAGAGELFFLQPRWRSPVRQFAGPIGRRPPMWADWIVVVVAAC